MKHFLTTPFYVRRHFKGESEPQLAPLHWLEHRFRLFQDYCLPSVIAQSNQTFEWLIYFDSTTPDTYLDKIRTLTSQYKNVSVVLCDVWRAEKVLQDISARADDDTRWIVTTRLDNDDGLHRDFVSNLHTQIEEQREFLNYPHGIVFYSRKFYLYRHLSNAFLSLVEPLDHAIGVWSVAHEQAERLAPIRQLSDWPAFLQVIHDKNVSNKPRGRRIRATEALSGFEAIPSAYILNRQDKLLNILWENATRVVLWNLRDRAISIVKKFQHN